MILSWVLVFMILSWVLIFIKLGFDSGTSKLIKRSVTHAINFNLVCADYEQSDGQ